MSAHPDTEDEDESEPEEANEGEVPVRTDSDSEEKIVCFNVSEFTRIVLFMPFQRHSMKKNSSL